MIFKIMAVIFTLGLDNLVMSTTIGVSKIKNRFTVSLVFGLFEGLMPGVGFLLGRSLGTVLGNFAFYAGLILIVTLGIYMIVTDDDDDKVSDSLKGWVLVVTAISISLDELAIGFTFGLFHFPIWITLILLGVQAFVFTYLGLTFGKYSIFGYMAFALSILSFFA